MGAPRASDDPTYTAALEVDRGYLPHLTGRASARYGKGDRDGAIEDYAKAIEIDPRNATAYYNRGTARADKGDWDGAIADHEKALEVAPQDWPHRRMVEAELAKLRRDRSDY